MIRLSELYNMIFIIGTILAIIMLIITIILFIKFNIPKVIGDLTGLSEKKGLKNMRVTNINVSQKRIKQDSKKKTKTNDQVYELAQNKNVEKGGNVHLTEKLNEENITMELRQEPVIGTTESKETEVLSDVELENVYFDIEKDITEIHTNEII